MSTNARKLGVKGFEADYNIHWNWSPARFYETAVREEGAQIAKGGALVVKTGKHTGRSATDKFVVRDEVTEDKVWWEATDHISPEQFNALREDFETHMKGLTLYGQDTFGGADMEHRLPVQIITEYAWHGLFVHHLLRQPTATELESYQHEYTIINLPSFRANPAKHGVRSGLAERVVLPVPERPKNIAPLSLSSTLTEQCMGMTRFSGRR